MTNTILPVRMFIPCTAVPYGKRFKSVKAKKSPEFFKKVLWRGSCIWCRASELNTTGDWAFKINQVNSLKHTTIFQIINKF